MYLVVTAYESFENDVMEYDTAQEAFGNARHGDKIYKLVEEIA